VSGPAHNGPAATVGVVCLRGDEVLLIRRGNPPRQGQWSIPGGRVEWGETLVAAALRELAEETGVEAELLGLIDVIDGLFGFGDDGEGVRRHYILIDYAARWVAGEPRGGDDATDARFFPLVEALAAVEWEETRRMIREAVARFG
jgi:8-oxo-dGTP diphosphatase